MKPPQPPKFVTLAIMTTITVVFWVFFSIYKILTAQTTPPVSEEILSPIKPSLDSESLNEIKNSLYFEDNQINPLTVKREQKPPQIETENEELLLTPTPTVEESIETLNETQDIDTTDQTVTAG